MTTLTASSARILLYRLLRRVAKTHEPIQITGKENNAVLISSDSEGGEGCKGSPDVDALRMKTENVLYGDY